MAFNTRKRRDIRVGEIGRPEVRAACGRYYRDSVPATYAGGIIEIDLLMENLIAIASDIYAVKVQ